MTISLTDPFTAIHIRLYYNDSMQFNLVRFIVIIIVVLIFCCLAEIAKRDSSKEMPTKREVTADHLVKLSFIINDYRRLNGGWPTSMALLYNKVPDTNIFLDGWGRQIIIVCLTNAPNLLWLESYGTNGLLPGHPRKAEVVVQLGGAK
jgi:hypothetical protein